MTEQSSVVRTTSTWSIVVVFLFVGAGLVVGLVALAGRTSQQISASENAMTTTALLQRASKFNVDYSRNVVGPVWDAWDPPSQAIISRADYVDRHAHCHAPALPRASPASSPVPMATKSSTSRSVVWPCTTTGISSPVSGASTSRSRILRPSRSTANPVRSTSPASAARSSEGLSPPLAILGERVPMGPPAKETYVNQLQRS